MASQQGGVARLWSISHSVSLAEAEPIYELDAKRLFIGSGFRVPARAVLDRLDLAVAAGEIHALVGTNGTGKSTPAYLIMGCASYRAGSGEIRFDGRSIDTLPAGTQPDTVLRFHGKGLPHFGSGQRGDLLLRLRVVVPELRQRSEFGWDRPKSGWLKVKHPESRRRLASADFHCLKCVSFCS